MKTIQLNVLKFKSMYFKEILKNSLVMVILISLTSCASVFRGNNTSKVVVISGTPKESNVYVNNELVGKSPINYEVKKRKEYAVKITKEGYKDFNTSIETKLNPLWTGVSLVGNSLLFELPTIYDFNSGAVKDIKTDAISFELQKVGDAVKTTGDNAEKIINPALRIRTGTDEYFLSYRTALTITTKDNKKIASNILEINPDYLVVAKNNTKIYYSDIQKIRILPSRRWYPTLTLVSVISPIVWYANSKVVKTNSPNCKKNIQEIKVVNRFKEHAYGKVKCF
jgi:hypothetical protein